MAAESTKKLTSEQKAAAVIVALGAVKLLRYINISVRKKWKSSPLR